MTIRRGASGMDVRKIQTRLAELGLYRGTIDGSFGGGTEGAVKVFQRNSGLDQNGNIDASTWAKLFPTETLPVSTMINQPVALRCLALTSSFETGDMPPECFCGVTGTSTGKVSVSGHCSGIWGREHSSRYWSKCSQITPKFVATSSTRISTSSLPLRNRLRTNRFHSRDLSRIRRISVSTSLGAAC